MTIINYFSPKYDIIYVIRQLESIVSNFSEVVMTILAECPICHRKQANKNRTCGGCDEDLNKAKGSKRVRYWIDYRVNGRHKREPVGFKLKDAQDAESKRRVQKRENKFFEILKDSKITFEDLTKWYLNLKSVQRLNSYSRLEGAFKNFNNEFGSIPVNKIRLEQASGKKRTGTV